MMIRLRKLLAVLPCVIAVSVMGVADVALGNPMGDLDCSNSVNMDDIDDFVMALVDPVLYTAMHPSCDIALADMNEDSFVDGLDIPLFAQAVLTGTPVEPPLAVQLAGNSLNLYPYFEYVKAFNGNATVELGIDPTLHPEVLGQTGDIYVVAAKTAGGWLADPSLVDVTLGGPMTVTFGGSTIQDNTFTVVGANELNTAVYEELTGDYTGLGAPYDMIIDFNQNGVLDGGDYIDGYGREAGLYAVHDVAAQGPLAVTESASYSVGAVFGIPSTKTYEEVYYPTNIAAMGELPLVMVSRGNGHDYRWYDHIGYHMASYGFVVMSHDNNTEPGTLTASLTTLGHTDAFLDQLDTIESGVLEGHVDSHKIIWIGHSRGAEGVAIAYDRITDSTPSYNPTHFTPEDVVLISSMLPTDFQGVSTANPHEANYHLWTASGDADVSGTASNDIAQTFHLHDRATRYRQSTVVQGTGHGDFHAASGSVFDGPCHIEPKSKVHDIMQGYFLPIIKHYAQGNIPASDFLWRQYEHFHPIGVDLSDPCIVVSHEYRNGSEDGNFMIDDYQTEYTSTSTSSSGGSVTFTVQNLTEGRLDDNNSSFSWTASDPFNGATQGSASDNTRGVVFDWTDTDRYLEWEVIPDQRNFADDLYLSFRGAQGTQHPNTLGTSGDTTFSVTLRDGNGTTSSINIGAYGGGLEQPYARNGGWHNEMEVIRIRLTDFLANGSGLDLSDVVAIRFNFGPSWGTSKGRIVIDELMLTNDYPPYFIPATISLTAVPEFVPAGTPIVIEAEIMPGNDSIVEDSAQLHYRYDGGSWQTIVMTPVVPGGEIYQAVMPPPTCAAAPQYYATVEGAITGPISDPIAGSANPYVSFVGTFVSIMDDNFNSDQGWTVVNDPSMGPGDGQWDRAIPGIDVDRGAPPADFDGSGYCYVTGDAASEDVDNGPTWLVSPTFDLSAMTNPVVRYARWWANDDQDGDMLTVEVSNDGGATWYILDYAMNVPAEWVERSGYVLDAVPSLTSQMKIRFGASDLPNNSKDEGAIDAFELFDVTCTD